MRYVLSGTTEDVDSCLFLLEESQRLFWKQPVRLLKLSANSLVRLTRAFIYLHLLIDTFQCSLQYLK